MPNNAKNVYREIIPRDVPIYLRKRYYLIALSFVGLVVNFLIRINLSISIVQVSSNKTTVVDNITYVKPPEHHWTPPEIGLILSSFSWGLMLTPIGLLIGSRFNGTTLYGYSILFTGFLTLLSPSLLLGNIYIYMCVRILEGILEGICSTCLYPTYVLWMPAAELSRSVNVVTLGIPAGTMISYPLAGYICYILNWRCMYYISGGIAVFWFILWKLTISNSPDTDKFITRSERMYLRYLNQANNPSSMATKKVKIPWWSILTSKPVLAYLNERFVESWSLSFLSYCLPLYIKDVHSVNVKDIGFFSAIPHFCAIFSMTIGSWLQDHIRKKNIISNTKLHKSFILFGQIFAIIILIVVGLSHNFYVNMIAFGLFKICFSIAEISYFVLPVELAMQHSNIIGSLAIVCISVGFLLNPIIMGFMVQNHLTSEWSRYFWFLSVFNIWGAIVFARYGSAEFQSWAKPTSNTDEEEPVRIE